MSVCTFFGHRECPEEIRPSLNGVLENLIVNHGVDTFYVGNQGQFDGYVRSSLGELSKKYPHIRCAVVLAYFPKPGETHTDTMLPEGIESIHPRFAISWRNDWMLRRSDYVVTYITHSWGGAARYAAKAARQGKHILPLA